MFNDIFRKRLDKAIRLNYHTQREFVAETGMCENVLSRYMTGRSLPSIKTIAKMAKALHVTSDYLLGIDDKQKDFKDIVLWLHMNAAILTEEQIKSLMNELSGNKEADKNDPVKRLRQTMTEIKALLDNLDFTYEALTPSYIRLNYPNSDDCTMISVCDGTDIAMSGKIIGSIDDLKKYLLNIKYYSP